MVTSGVLYNASVLEKDASVVPKRNHELPAFSSLRSLTPSLIITVLLLRTDSPAQSWAQERTPEESSELKRPSRAAVRSHHNYFKKKLRS